jgi:hypothetical protein
MDKTRIYKGWTIALSIVSGLLLLVVVFQFSTTIPKDEVREREKLLAAVMREVKIPKEDIEEIVVLWSKANEPYKYDVAINMKSGKQILYGWVDEKKNEVRKW